jgi:hypothetical protein
VFYDVSILFVCVLRCLIFVCCILRFFNFVCLFYDVSILFVCVLRCLNFVCLCFTMFNFCLLCFTMLQHLQRNFPYFYPANEAVLSCVLSTAFTMISANLRTWDPTLIFAFHANMVCIFSNTPPVTCTVQSTHIRLCHVYIPQHVPTHLR